MWKGISSESAPRDRDLRVRDLTQGATGGGRAECRGEHGRGRMSELILIGYPDENTAGDVWHKLAGLRRDILIDMDDAAVICRDAKGKLHMTTPAHRAVAWGSLSGFFWGTVIGLVLLPFRSGIERGRRVDGAALGIAEDLGIMHDFRRQARNVMQPGTSAILVVVRKATRRDLWRPSPPTGEPFCAVHSHATPSRAS